MNMYMPNSFERALLGYLRSTFTDFSAQLFVNNITINSSTEYGDLTIASYPGYAHDTVSFAGTIDTDGEDQARTPQVVIEWPAPTSGGDASVFGFCLVDRFSSMWISGNFVGAPLVIIEGGDPLETTCRWLLYVPFA